MTILQWFIFFIAIQLIHFGGSWKLYQKAGRKSWEALIPVYNAIVLMQIIRRPKWWVILLFIPIINLMIFPVVWVETLRSFGKNSSLDTNFWTLYLHHQLQQCDQLSSRSQSSPTNLVWRVDQCIIICDNCCHPSPQLLYSTLHNPYRIIRKNTSYW
jgi:signal peptidase I